MTSSEVLTQTVERLGTATSLETVTELVAGAVRALTGADGATFVLREDQKCFYADEDAIGPLWKGSRFPMTSCISGWAMMHKRSCSCQTSTSMRASRSMRTDRRS